MVKLKKKAVKKAVAADEGRKVTGHIKGFNSGKTSGLSVAAFWTKLFRSNFKAKLTDAQLAAAFKAEFPKREAVTAVARHRSWFNRGAQGYGDGEARAEAKRSVAYDKKGEVTRGDWGDRDKKPNKKLSEIARKRAVKMWAAKRKAGTAKPKSASKAPPAKPKTAVKKKPAKVKAAAPAAKTEKATTPAGKGKKAKKFKLKGSKSESTAA